MGGGCRCGRCGDGRNGDDRAGERRVHERDGAHRGRDGRRDQQRHVRRRHRAPQRGERLRRHHDRQLRHARRRLRRRNRQQLVPGLGRRRRDGARHVPLQRAGRRGDRPRLHEQRDRTRRHLQHLERAVDHGQHAPEHRVVRQDRPRHAPPRRFRHEHLLQQERSAQRQHERPPGTLRPDRERRRAVEGLPPLPRAGGHARPGRGRRHVPCRQRQQRRRGRLARGGRRAGEGGAPRNPRRQGPVHELVHARVLQRQDVDDAAEAHRLVRPHLRRRLHDGERHVRDGAQQAHLRHLPAELRAAFGNLRRHVHGKQPLDFRRPGREQRGARARRQGDGGKCLRRTLQRQCRHDRADGNQGPRTIHRQQRT